MLPWWKGRGVCCASTSPIPSENTPGRQNEVYDNKAYKVDSMAVLNTTNWIQFEKTNWKKNSFSLV
mgnify:CR=1 FL=1